MTFDELWKELVKQQPRLAQGSETIMFSVTGFRLILKQVYDEGVATACVNHKRPLSIEEITKIMGVPK